jgi:putative transposase
MKIEIHRQIEGRIKTMTIKKEAGKYYAIFIATKEIKVPEIEDAKPVGIDMGLNNFVALSDGKTVQKPKFVKRASKSLARWQRKIARRRKGSNRRDAAKERLQHKWEQTTNRSNDFTQKLSTQLVNSRYTSFAVEKLSINNMVKNHNLAGSIYNASWRKFVNMLSYKAESAGMKVTEVDPRGTTQECSNCGYIKTGKEKLELEERIYHCNICNTAIDRDVNASIVILKRGREGHSRTYAWGDGVRPQQTAVVREPRTYSALQSINAEGSPGF